MSAAPVAAPPVAVLPENKPGFATTEFWVAGVAPAIISLLTLFNVGHVDLTKDPRTQAIIKAAGLIAAAIGAAFYARSRGHMKAGAAIKTGLDSLGQSLSTIDLTKTATALDPALFAQVSGEIKAIDPLLSDAQLEQFGELVSTIVHSHLTNVIVTPAPPSVPVPPTEAPPAVNAPTDVPATATPSAPVSTDPAGFQAPTFS